MTKPQQAPPASLKLPKYVGYEEIEDSFGIVRRTIERMVKKGRFPAPTQLSDNRVGWPIETVLGWLEQRQKGLIAKAVTNPAELKPEQVVPTMQELGALLVKDKLGETVAPDSIEIRIVRDVTNDEFTDYRGQFLGRLEELCGHFSYDRAMFVSASLFPAIREKLSVDGKFGHFRDADQLREFCVQILDDKWWPELEKALAAAAAG